MIGASTVGPLSGLRVVELSNAGPSGHAAMILADLGADVVCVQRPGTPPRADDQIRRGRTIVTADLRDPDASADVLDLISRADILVEGFRPGVVERLGLGPDTALARNPRLVYARVTGWGQEGPRAQQAGHDINFLAPTGILHAMGRPDDRPIPPLNLVAGFAGGSMFLVVGVLAALWERTTSGRGQVVDAAAADGAALLAQLNWSMRAHGQWSDTRGENLVDGSCPYLDTYECADGRYMAVGAFEEQFYTRMLDVLGLDAARVPDRRDRAHWPALREVLAAEFRTRSRAQWADVFDAVDACVTPVLDFSEAPRDAHFVERGTFAEIDGVVQPAPSPRFSRTPTATPSAPPRSPLTPRQVWRDDPLRFELRKEIT
ncbi:CaiB/BaiF CoA-transferase family protein [Rhodococcus oxybenzonivorans]|uniref:CaiB/BaiF CoA transferase family protein n=1 Tax=Rhodococcus oxybenzonivorans TaxID=1990687 RepID=UPI002953CF0F|nr:CaiB/BaiF CoA-transferase family protein [Rhodococcus oxybenzonivorans]MDV7352788.1 CaiB/BaiF CoA-transferase family protein [Rhodococcus oxybenzonivorans]